jgi:hypothetical protein
MPKKTQINNKRNYMHFNKSSCSWTREKSNHLDSFFSPVNNILFVIHDNLIPMLSIKLLTK